MIKTKFLESLYQKPKQREKGSNTST